MKKIIMVLLLNIILFLNAGAHEVREVYITPQGEGQMDGSSIKDSIGADKEGGLQRAWDSLGNNGVIYILEGEYRVPQTLVIKGNESKGIIGVKGKDGKKPVFYGDWHLNDQSKRRFIVAEMGSGNWKIEGIGIKNYNSAIYTHGKNKKLEIRDLEIEEVVDGIYIRGGAALGNEEDASNNIIIEGLEINKYTKRGIRIIGGSYDVLVKDTNADQGGKEFWREGNFPFSYQVADSNQEKEILDRNITFINVKGGNNYHEDGKNYWNADTFVAARSSRDIKYINCYAYDNTDGGWDDKSVNPILIDCVSEGSKRNYRFWSKEASLYNCISKNPIKRGGSGRPKGIWISEGTKVKLYNFTLLGSDSSELDVEGIKVYLK